MDLLTRSLMMTAGGGALNNTLAFVGSSNKQVPVGTTSGSGTTITLSGLRANDVVFLTHVAAAASSTVLENASADLSSSTWTQVASASTSNPNLGLWYTVSTGTSVTVDVEYEPISEANAYVLCLYAFRGCNTTDSILEVGAVFGNGANLPLTDIDVPPGFDTYAVGIGGLDDDINVTFSMPEEYTEIFQGDSGSAQNSNATMAIAYTPLSADTAITGKSFTASSPDTYKTFQFFLIANGKDAVPPVITGSSTVSAAIGGTTVATYTADKEATWSLGGTDASLFSISSGGVVTYNSASTTGARDIIVQADNVDGIRSYLPVTVNAYDSGGSAGGGITMVRSTSGSTDARVGDPLILTLSNLQSGDVVFFTYASYNWNGTFVESDGSTESLAGYTQVDTSYTGSKPENKLFYKAVTSTSESLEFIAQSTGGQRCAIGLFAFRGVDNTDPILDMGSVRLGTSKNSNISDHFILDDSVEVVIAGLDRDNATSTPPTGYTEIIDQNEVGGGSFSATIHVSRKNVNGNTTESSRRVVFSLANDSMGYSFTLRPD